MTNEEKLKRLEEQKEKAKQRAKEIERKMKSIRAKEQAEQRKLETRKKILLGSMLLEQMNKNDLAYRNVINDLDKFLTRDIDRELFNLPLKSE